MGSFLGHRSLIGAMRVVGLIRGDKGSVDGVVHSKSQ